MSDPLKSGVKTSEHTLVLLVGLLAIASGFEVKEGLMYYSLDKENLQWFMGLAATYVGGRSLTKFGKARNGG